jgi:hypothetical protein
MGCDYYIYSVLKIIHTNGETLIKLSQEPVYLYNTDYEETDNFTIHPSKRRPKPDYLAPDVDDVLIYKKGENISNVQYLPQYMELIDELMKEYADENYLSKNEIIANNSFFTFKVNGESLKSVDDIQEMYVVELREWRNSV